MKKITLCGRGRCCPVVTFKDMDNILIDDDYGNQIRITSKDLDDLVDKYDKGEIYWYVVFANQDVESKE